MAPTLTYTPTITPTLVPMEVVFIPAGEFLMGTNESGFRDDEDPEHSVYLNDYWIHKYEVTNAQYGECIQAGLCDADLEDYPEDNYPAVFVSWQEANDYCQWAGGRLPTEAEWEKAARGEESLYPFPWGEGVDCSLATFAGCVSGNVPVGSYPDGVSPYGGLDMAGNVWEWVADWYDPNYYERSPAINPQGPENNDYANYRVIRGGSWNHEEFALHVTVRFGMRPTSHKSGIGFRCVFDEAP
jgi:formylglycine-generating enzyme required for sulfatase activity